MSFIAAAIIGGAGLVGGLGGAFLQSNAAKSASQAQVGLGYQALGQQKQMFGVAQNALQPFINTGSSVLDSLRGMVGAGGAGPSPDALANNPVLNFLSKYGTMATTNALSSRGLGASAGPVATAVGQYNTGLANTFWKDVVGALTNTASLGAGAAGSLGGLATQTGGLMGNTLSGIGSSTAAGTLGSANALAGGLTGGANSIATAYLLSKFLPGGGGGGGMYGSNPNAFTNAINNPQSAAVPTYGSPWG